MEETKDWQEQKNEILAEVKSYAQAEYEYARLRVIDKLSYFIGSLLLTICLILVAFAVLAFCAVAAVIALAQVVPAWAACLIVGAFYLVLIPILVACSKQLFVNPIINKLSGFKNSHELQCESLRAEGRVALHRERMGGRVRFVQNMYNYYTHLLQTGWTFIRKLFKK
jgi:hypothetical protein